MTTSAPEIVLRPTGEIDVVRRAPARERWSWSLYDFANTIFSMNIVTLYFSVWIARDLAAGTGPYAIASSISSVLVAVSIPVFGLISDQRRRRKPWVVGLTLVCVAATAMLGVVGGHATAHDGSLLLILAIFVAANYAYQGALPFYNAMMTELVPAGEQGRLSGYGTAIGYVGSIVGMLLIVPFVAGATPLGPVGPRVMGLLHRIPFTAGGGRAATFVPTALAFLIFSLPLFLWCRDHIPVPKAERTKLALVAPFRELVRSVSDSRRHPGLLRFILTSYFYQDAIGTVISFMAIYAVTVMKFPDGTETTLFIVLTVPSIIGAAIIGRLSDRYGPKRTLMGVLLGWSVLLLAMVVIRGHTAFWVLGGALGLLFGGIWTVERPMLLTLVPDADAGRYFGLLVLSARAASIVGPLIWALIVDVVFGGGHQDLSFRVAMGVLAVFMALAAWLLVGVPDRHAERLAARAA